MATEEQKHGVGQNTLKIHKYSNRRYYDITRGMHLTIEQIHQLILEGYDVSVLESKTGKDVTVELLTHIILEYDASKLNAFSRELLHHIVRTNSNVIYTFMDKYFNEAFLTFMESQESMQECLREKGSDAESDFITPMEVGAQWADMFLTPLREAFSPTLDATSEVKNMQTPRGRVSERVRGKPRKRPPRIVGSSARKSPRGGKK